MIKVEIPGTGDDSRAYGPFANGKSLYFSALNYDKQSIALNLKQAPDREIFEELVGIIDGPGRKLPAGPMEKLGYGWETLHARYPQLIYGAASPYNTPQIVAGQARDRREEQWNSGAVEGNSRTVARGIPTTTTSLSRPTHHDRWDPPSTPCAELGIDGLNR